MPRRPICPAVSLLIAAASLVGCGGEKPSGGPAIIPADSMAAILAEVHITDALLVYASNQKRVAASDLPKYYAGMLQKMGVDKARFDASIRHYADDPKQLSKIYDTVLDDLNARATAVKAAKTPAPAKAQESAKGNPQG